MVTMPQTNIREQIQVEGRTLRSMMLLGTSKMMYLNPVLVQIYELWVMHCGIGGMRDLRDEKYEKRDVVLVLL